MTLQMQYRLYYDKSCHRYGVAWFSRIDTIIGLFCKTFAKEPYKRDDTLQKRLITLSILLTVALERLACVNMYECIISHIHASRHIRMRHGTYECVTSHMNESRYI